MIENLDSPYIQAADSENFKELVLGNSHQGPVLVNFWSRKAGPCLRQYPILDKLAHDYGGRLLLVNVDTEQEFIFTKQYAVTSVPMLKLFRNGSVVETWRGYQSEADLSRILDLYVSRDSDRIIAEAVARYADGRTVEAYDMLAKAIVEDPINPRLPLAVCKLLKHEQRFAEALTLLEALPDSIRKQEEMVQLKEVLSFCHEVDQEQDIPGLQATLQSRPQNMVALQQLAAHYVMQQDYESALQSLEAMLDIDMNWQQNYPQTALLRLMKILGDAHTLTPRIRTQLRRYEY
jgi:putative thioredoxin